MRPLSWAPTAASAAASRSWSETAALSTAAPPAIRLKAERRLRGVFIGRGRLNVSRSGFFSLCNVSNTPKKSAPVKWQTVVGRLHSRQGLVESLQGPLFAQHRQEVIQTRSGSI